MQPQSPQIVSAADDTRNVVDRYKGWPQQQIIDDLDACGTALEIAIDNVSRDFNMGTIVRTANAFGVRHIHIVGRRQWNKRGAMMTDTYLHVHYYDTVDALVEATARRLLIAIDNVAGSTPLGQTVLPPDGVLLFGAEGPGIRPELLQRADMVVAIEQFGSTRSLNVGVAAGIAMYAWLQQQKLV